MTNALIALAVFASAALTAALVIGPIRRFAERFEILDQPSARRVRQAPVPRLGGLAIFFGFLVGLGVSFVLPVERFPDELGRIVVLLIGAGVVVGTMFFDDVLGLRPLTKLAIQFGAASLVVLPRLRDTDAGIVIEQFNVPFWGGVTLPLAAAIGFTLFWIVGMMNALNWIDGLDGLAGSISLIAASVLFLHTYFVPEGNPQFTLSLLAAALGGGIVGFLPFNWHPSRIIMGDNGAMFLGFALATISIIGGAKIATALLALGVPILDTAWVIVYRLMRGRSPLEADRGHLHHRLLDAGWTQPQIVGAYAGLAGLFGVFGLLLPNRELKLVALLALGLVVVGLVGWLARHSPSHGPVGDEVA
jgi:UDP-N-acetylmuramyl pentapeptide phosphotransferase/UDP-N-acetylglucosamine-1-phosphate transferase